MSNPESRHTCSTNTSLRKAGVPFVWKVNERTTGGIPDCLYRGPIDYLWVEYKYIERVKPPTEVPNMLSDLQKEEIKKLNLTGAEVWVAYFIKLRDARSPEVYIVDASDPYAERFAVIDIHSKAEFVNKVAATTGVKQ